MGSAEGRHESLVVKTTGYEHKNDENEMEKEMEKGKKKQGFDKDLVLKKMEKFLKSVQSEKDENKKTETSPNFRLNDRPHRNLSESDRSDTKQSSNTSKSLSSQKRDKNRRERTRSKSKSKSRSASRKRRHHKLRERSDDSFRIHYRIRANQKVREERKENENEKDKLKKNYDRIDRYEENDQHERHDRRKRYEHRHRKESSQNSRKRRESDRRSQRMDEKKTSSCSSDRFENDKYTYKERKRYREDCAPRDRKKEWERTNHGSEPKYRNNSKYVYNKYTGEKIETKFFHVPLGFHVTKENWRAYTKWLKRKNKYRFDIPFDQYEIYRRSSSLSPSAWEEFVNDSEENETEEETLEKDTTRKGRHKEEKKKGREGDKEDGDTESKEKHKKEKKKSKRRDREDEDEDENTTRKEKPEKERKKRKRENSEEENTSSSSESFDSLDSTTETKKRKKREQIKKRKKKKHDHKKKVSKEKKGKREKGRKRRKRRESKKRKTVKENNKRKEDTEQQNPLDSDKESISSSLTSVSFLNEEMELEDEVLVQGKALKEDKTKYIREKNTDVKGANKENVRIEHEEKEEHFSKRKERSLVKEPNELNQRETVKNDLKEKQEQMSDNESDIGPMPLDINVKLANKPINYGVAMMPGEGEAIAQFVQKGKRIPRRGEVGLSAEAIENYEKLGYVMSGSRHKRMNAIRMRKENQVYSVEEQRALAMFNYEERAMRENALINDLREILRKQNEAIMHEKQNENE